MLKSIGKWIITVILGWGLEKLRVWLDKREHQKTHDDELVKKEEENLAKVLAAKTEDEREKAASDSLSF